MPKFAPQRPHDTALSLRIGARVFPRLQQQTPAAEVSDPGFQDQLAAKLAELTSVSLF
jgi:hypothetical protein